MQLFRTSRGARALLCSCYIRVSREFKPQISFSMLHMKNTIKTKKILLCFLILLGGKQKLRINYNKRLKLSLKGNLSCGSVDRVSAHPLTSRRFASKGTYPGCRFIPTPGWGACGRQLVKVSLSHGCFSLSLLLPPPFHSL